MDQEVYRFVLALVLTGLVLFAWQYYQDVFLEKPSDPVEDSQQTEIAQTQKTTIRHDLSKYENCGHLKIVVYPIYKALEFLNKRTKNLGIALVLLTLAIRALLAPLTFKQLQGSRKMAVLQGEVQRIKRRYGENPLKMQKAIGRLFKENGVHPLGSLGLVLFQIPLFIALYKIVNEAHIFSGASLGLWIQDLGVPDPYFVLPLIAGFVMFLNTKLSGGPNTQIPKWLTYVFSVLFAGFLLKQPAGLTLYILVGSLFQLAMTAATCNRFCVTKGRR
jgi:YidC/Oxa1 family membrane protein insertase